MFKILSAYLSMSLMLNQKCISRVCWSYTVVGRVGGFRLGGLTVIEFAGEVKVYIMINDNLQPDRELLDLYNLCAKPLNY